MNRNQLKSLIKAIIKESIHDVNPEFKDGTVRPMSATGLEENEFDGKKLPKHNAKITSEEEKEANEIAKKIWKDELKSITFHSKSLNGRATFFKVNTGSTYYRWLNKNEQGQWFYTDDGGIRSKWVPFKNEVNEMSSSGAAGAYSSPFAFTNNKKGSPRGIAAAKKYGTVVGESPRV